MDNPIPNPPPSLAELFVDGGSKQLINSSPANTQPKALEAGNVDFDKAAANYWNSRGKKDLFQKGSMLGKANSVSFDDFFKKFQSCFEEVIRHELNKGDKTSEKFSPDFKTLFYLFNMVGNHLKQEQVNLNSEDFLATFHGFITSYITSINK